MSAPVRASHAAFATPDLAREEPVPPTTATAASARPGSRVLIPGTWRTFENREVLRGMGLRWDPPTHAWHGDLSLQERTVLRERFGLAIRPVVALEVFQRQEVAEIGLGSGPEPTSPARPPIGPVRSGYSQSNLPSRAVHDGSRTRAEARLVLKSGVPDPDDPESRFDSDAGNTFSWWDVTSGLPDDSREADERVAVRHLADLRGRVKRARAEISTNDSLSLTLAKEPIRAAAFYRRFGVTAELLRAGVPAGDDGSREPR